MFLLLRRSRGVKCPPSPPNGTSKRAAAVCALFESCTACSRARTTGITISNRLDWVGRASFARSVSTSRTFAVSLPDSCSLWRPSPAPKRKHGKHLPPHSDYGGVASGQHWSAPEGVPALGGIAEYFSDQPVRPRCYALKNPLPGWQPSAHSMSAGRAWVAINFYLYGDNAAAVAEREQPVWQAWVQEHFPAESGANPA